MTITKEFNLQASGYTGTFDGASGFSVGLLAVIRRSAA
jgi:hypothetical protein